MLKFRKALALVLSAAITVSALPVGAFADTSVTQDEASTPVLTGAEGFSYTIAEDGTVSICGYTAPDDGADITVPSEIGGLKVTAIAEEAFARNEDIVSVVIPSTVRSIGNSAFYHAKKLETIVFLCETPDLGFTAVEGCVSLRGIYSLTECDLTEFCAILVSDLGEEAAREIMIYEYDTESQLMEALYGFETSEVTVSSEPENSDISVEDTTINEGITDEGEISGGTTGTVDPDTAVTASGECGAALTWSLASDGTLTIDGTGAMTDYEDGDAPWYAYRQSITSLDIGEGVTGIGENAFNGCEALTGELIIPETVTDIGNRAFYKCYGITSLTVGGTGTVIGIAAFSFCSALTELTLRSGTDIIMDWAFSNCDKLTALTLPEGITEIRSSAFESCGAVSGELILPKSLVKLGGGAFYECTGITGELIIPDNVTTVDADAFYNCDGITSVTVGVSVTSIDCAFRSCDSIKSMTFNSTAVPLGNPLEDVVGLESVCVPKNSFTDYVTNYGKALPDGARFGVIGETEDFCVSDGVLLCYLGSGGDVTVPDGVTAIGESAFRGCDTLTSVIIPEGVTTIGDYAFYGCTALESVDFPEGVTYIGSYAFRYCDSLAELTLPIGLKTICDYAFANCVGLAGDLEIPYDVSFIGNYAFFCCTFNGRLIINGGSGLTIGAGAFERCSGFTELKLGEGIVAIGGAAFLDCSGIEGELVLPSTLTTIELSAFERCTGITSITFPDKSLTSIGNYAFDSCTGLAGELVIPDSVTFIGTNAFRNCSELTSVTFGAGLSEVNAAPFLGCGGIKTVTFMGATPPMWNPLEGMSALEVIYVPQDSYDTYVEALGTTVPSTASFHVIGADTDFVIEDGVLISYAGEGGEIVIPEGVTRIGDSAFQNNTTVTKVTFASTVTSVGTYAFNGCTALTEVVFNEGLLTLERSAFYQCTALTSIELPSTLTTIGRSAFNSCTSLTGDINIPASVTLIDYMAFRSCTGINGTVTIEAGSSTVIGEYAFYYCNYITGLVLGEGVTSIGAYAFNSCSRISGELKLPDSLTSIGAYAFDSCLRISGELKLPDSLTSIGGYAFRQCRGLTGALVIPDGVTTIESCAFLGCTGITSITIGEGVTYIGGAAFKGCSAVKSITMRCTAIPGGSYPYNEMSPAALEAIYVPESAYTKYMNTYSDTMPYPARILIKDASSDFVISSSGKTMYGYVGSDSTVTVPDGITTISHHALKNCTFITELNLPEGITYIGNGALESLISLKTLTLPSTVTTIEGWGLYNNTALESVYLPEGLTSIGRCAFQNASSLKSLTLPSTLTTIGASAFAGCVSVTGELIIPESVTTIGTDAFSGMKGITTITFKRSTPPAGVDYAVNGLTGLTTVYVPANSYDAYVAKLEGKLPEGAVIAYDLGTSKVADLTAAVYSKTVVLTWDEHLSDEVVGYRLMRDGVQIADVTGTSYTDRELETGGSYTYTIYGYTADGRTTAGTTLSVTPALPVISDITASNTLNKIGLQNGAVSICLKNNGNLAPLDGLCAEGKLYFMLDGERVEIGGFTVDTDPEGAQTVIYTVNWDVSDVSDGEYELLAVITDIDGGASSYTETFIVDKTVPERIVNLIAIGEIEHITLSWAIAAEIDTTYRLYRKVSTDESFTFLCDINDRSTLSYTDDNVDNDKIYNYYIVGVNDFGQEGEPSIIAAGTLIEDLEAPVVTKLTPQNGKYLNGEIVFRVTSEDNVAVTRAELYYSIDGGESWEALTARENDSFAFELATNELPDGNLRVKAVVFDAAGNDSAPMTYVYCVDNNGPEQVSGVTYTATSVNVTLSWNDVSDNDINCFVVEYLSENGEYAYLLKTDKTLGANILNLKPNMTYTYRVVGYDIQGNRGTPSEPITVTTTADETSPVVTLIRPTSGYYSDKIDLSFGVEDDYNVESVRVEISFDREAWEVLYEDAYEDIGAYRGFGYTLELSDYAEGEIYIRAVACDSFGNESLSDDTAPFVQHIIDRTAPASPENVAAAGYGGFIEVSWVQGSERDLNKYSVYRAEGEGEYALIASNLASVNYIDRNVVGETQYFYIVTVNDLAGNESEPSDVVTATVVPDIEAPEIVSIYPADGAVIGPQYRTVSVLALDNSRLAQVQLEYSLDGVSYTPLASLNDLTSYNATLRGEIPADKLTDGVSVYVRASVCDAAGNTVTGNVMTYTADLTAPEVESVSAEHNADNDSVILYARGMGESDLAGYRVYRAEKGSEDFTIILQRQAEEDVTLYTLTDPSLTKSEVTYTYRVEAVDTVGNTSYRECEIYLEDRSVPKAVIACDSVFEVGVEYYIDASQSSDDSAIVSYHFDFGDGTESHERKAVHKYTELGTYVITLTITDDSGNSTTTAKTVTVKERALIGNINIRVVDEDGSIVPNAAVYFDLGEEDQVIKYTNSSGVAAFTAEVGRHTVGCIIANNEWLPAKKEVVVKTGEASTVTMTMVHQTLVEGHFEIERMTFEEIIAAGIDISKPENQYFVRVTVYIEYKGETVTHSFPYNPSTGECDSAPIRVGDRTFYPAVIGPGGFSEGGGFEPGGEGGYGFSEEVSVAMFEIPIDVSSLKEFFDVKLHILNNASEEFSMLNNVVTLNLPEGLTVMDTMVSENSATVKIAEIKGQTSETIRWIIRGDEVGEYYLEADYSGYLSQFNALINTKFVAEDPIEVYGLSNLKLYVEIPDELDHATLYYNASLINEGDIDVYMPALSTPDVLIEAELFDDKGTNLMEKLGLTAEDCEGNDFVTSFEGDVGILKPGYAIRKHYMCIDQTEYSETKYVLDRFWYEMENSYGLTVEIVVKPLSYFKSYLDAGVNAVEKAEQLITSAENRSAYEYIMANENYMYWRMYSTHGELLPSKEEGDLWNLLEGDFGELLFETNSDELIRAILVELMDITAEADSELTKYVKAVKWLDNVVEFIKTNGIDKVLGEAVDEYGKALPHVFETIKQSYKWDLYLCITGYYGDSEKFIISQWKAYLGELEITVSETFETEASKKLHKLYSADGFEKVWEGIGFTIGTAQEIVKAVSETQVDIAMFIAAQSNLDNCYLFLDSIISYVPSLTPEFYLAYNNYSDKFFYTPAGLKYLSSLNITEYESFLNDCVQVTKCAKDVKLAIEDYDPIGKFIRNLLDNGVEFITDELIGKGIDVALDAIGIGTGGIVLAVKAALKLAVLVGNSVFNVSERHDIADNIRYLSVLTLAFEDAAVISRLEYLDNRGDDAAAEKHLRLLSYLLDIRRTGESQVALLGVSYEVLAGVFDSEELFCTVCDITGINDVKTWFEWRDVVEDRLSLMRVQLFKNPVKTEITGLAAPVVTFDYVNGTTAQSFTEEYQYSIDGGEWITCDGGPITVDPGTFPKQLAVERIDKSNTDMMGTGYCTVYGVTDLSGSGIAAVKTHLGYFIDNLDNDRSYEVTFTKNPIDFHYGDKLEIAIPDGSYSFPYPTENDYKYAYIRATADENGFASDVLVLEIVEFVEAWDMNHTTQNVKGAMGSMDYENVKKYFARIDETASVSDKNGDSAENIGTGYTLTVGGKPYTVIVTADVNGDAVIDEADVMAMLSHVTFDSELTDIYLEAGCVLGGTDIDIFDIFAAYDFASGANG